MPFFQLFYFQLTYKTYIIQEQIIKKIFYKNVYTWKQIQNLDYTDLCGISLKRVSSEMSMFRYMYEPKSG